MQDNLIFIFFFKVRFESIRTMTEARIVLEHLFEKNVEGTMGAKELKSEFGELKQIYDESVRNTNALEAEIAGMKGEHETEKVSGGYPYKQHSFSRKTKNDLVPGTTYPKRLNLILPILPHNQLPYMFVYVVVPSAHSPVYLSKKFLSHPVSYQ